MQAAEWAVEQMHHSAMISQWERDTHARLLALIEDDGTIEGPAARRLIDIELADDGHVLELLGEGWTYDDEPDVYRPVAEVPPELLRALDKRLSTASKPGARDEAAFEATRCLEVVEQHLRQPTAGCADLIRRQVARAVELLGGAS